MPRCKPQNTTNNRALFLLCKCFWLVVYINYFYKLQKMPHFCMTLFFEPSKWKGFKTLGFKYCKNMIFTLLWIKNIYRILPFHCLIIGHCVYFYGYSNYFPVISIKLKGQRPVCVCKLQTIFYWLIQYNCNEL